MKPTLCAFLALIFTLSQIGCAQKPLPVEKNRTVAGVQKSVFEQCRALLSYKPEQQFDFDLFCKTRDKIASGERLTLENWEQKSPEELMAIIEAFSLASFGSQKGLEESQVKVSQARMLKAQIVKLQKSKKNQERKIRELVAYWYRLTHEQSTLKLLKNNMKSVNAFFVKVSEDKRIERVEAELAQRGVIEAFESVGFYGHTTYWQKFKNYLNKKRNEKNLALATLFTIPAVLEANVLFAFLPVWDFSKAEKLADRYQDIAFQEGHNKAHEIIRQESRTKGTFSTYARMVAHTVNTAFMAALIMTSVNAYQAEMMAQQEALELSVSAESQEQINESYITGLADKIIKEREAELGRRLSEKEKQNIRDQFNVALQSAQSKLKANE